ncbi:MAG TPA: hypothetical protein VLM17_09315 [Xanthomonadaceae bacterium]|nr:hypothetical protein [Xanthomonadaceae bacterium]
MNTAPARESRAPFPPRNPSAPTAAAAPRYPERDFGVGYGRSSGYATTRTYAVAWTGAARFRCR